MSWLSKALGLSSSQNPANAAMPYLNQIPGVGHQYYDPYINKGREAESTLSNEYSKQLDPTQFMDSIMQNYKRSGAYNNRHDDLMKEMSAMSASGGYAGTPMAMKQGGEAVNRLMSEDEQQYLKNALGIYDQGIAGTQDFYNKGFQGSGSMADLLGSNLAQQGGLAYQGQASQNQNRQALINSLMKALGQGAAGGVGYAAGGWQGAANTLTGGGNNWGGNNHGGNNQGGNYGY